MLCDLYDKLMNSELASARLETGPSLARSVYLMSLTIFRKLYERHAFGF